MIKLILALYLIGLAALLVLGAAAGAWLIGLSAAVAVGFVAWRLIRPAG